MIVFDVTIMICFKQTSVTQAGMHAHPHTHTPTSTNARAHKLAHTNQYVNMKM